MSVFNKIIKKNILESLYVALLMWWSVQSVARPVRRVLSIQVAADYSRHIKGETSTIEPIKLVGFTKASLNLFI